MEFRKAIGNRIYGCDDASYFVPGIENRPPRPRQILRFGTVLDNPSLIDLFQLTESEFLALTEGSAMRRIGYAQWQRNLAVGLGNSEGGRRGSAGFNPGIGQRK